jgi:hypothetical protein
MQKPPLRGNKNQGDDNEVGPSDDDMSERSSNWAYTPQDLQNPDLIKLIISRIDPSKSARARSFVLLAEGLLEDFGTPIAPGTSRVIPEGASSSSQGGAVPCGTTRRPRKKEGEANEGESTTSGRRRRSRSRGQEEKDKDGTDGDLDP